MPGLQLLLIQALLKTFTLLGLIALAHFSGTLWQQKQPLKALFKGIFKAKAAQP